MHTIPSVPRRPARVLGVVVGIAGVLAVLWPARAAATDGDTEVRPARVSAGMFFAGTTLSVRGTADEASDVVIRVVGPLDLHTYNRRGKIAGLIWGGVEHVTFSDAPSVYGLYTSAALRSITDPDTRVRLGLGLEALRARIRATPPGPDPPRLADDFVKLKQREGLYRLDPGGVQLEDAHGTRRRFHAALAFPATVPPGQFEVTVFQFARGALVATDRRTVDVERVGLPAHLFALAHSHGFLFGVLAVMASIATGLGTGLLANSRRLTRPRRLGAPTHPAEAAIDEAAPETPVIGAVLRTLRQALSPHPFGPPPSADLDILRSRYRVFRDLLRVNNEVLELLSELEEESSWTSFSRPKVRMGIRALFDGTTDMVKLLNELTADRYFDLLNVVSGIRGDVMGFLSRLEDEGHPGVLLNLKEITSANAGRVGGKALNLARLECDLGVRVPASFVVTTDAYRQLLECGDLGSKLRAVLAPARLDAPEDFARRCDLAQRLLDETEMPAVVGESIARAWTACGIGDDEGAALRSSASGEDSELSFAGQFDTLLNVPRADVSEAWKRVVRSRFAARAVFYRRAGGLAEVDTPMAVLVQRMVRSRASGVIFTRRPDDAKAAVLLLNAVFGLGPDVSAGTADADELVISRRPPRRILERRIARKTDRLVCAAGGGLAREAVELGAQIQPALTDEEALDLADRALAIEEYFGGPQDIEWTIDTSGALFILQARPLRTTAAERGPAAVPPDAPLLIHGGQPVWSGRAVGPVYYAATTADLDHVPRGSILVASHLLPDCVRFLPMVSGLIVEQGTVTGHAASIVREFRVPSLFGVKGATRTLVPGQMVSLDVFARSVYAGALWRDLQSHLPLTVIGRRAIGLPTVLASKLTKLSGSAFVSSWACQSLHDVIRFAHEMAILAMFDIGDRLLESQPGAVKQVQGPPHVFLHLLDLGGGLRPEAATRRTVTGDDVISVPFLAFWRGLAGDDDVPRPPIDGLPPRSLASVVASTVTSSGPRDLGVPNYACVTGTYLNLNSRQAYHYAVVDAFLSDTQNSNHVSVRLTGGGAPARQRSLRVRFMSEVLRHHRFRTTVTGDILSAWCRGIDQATGAAMLTTVGRLLRFSAQLDLLMEEDTQVPAFVDAFVKAEAARTGPPVERTGVTA
jgi:pyruvate, water dikinase